MCDYPQSCAFRYSEDGDLPNLNILTNDGQLTTDLTAIRRMTYNIVIV
jgi:hypothetical protein